MVVAHLRTSECRGMLTFVVTGTGNSFYHISEYDKVERPFLEKVPGWPKASLRLILAEGTLLSLTGHCAGLTC